MSFEELKIKSVYDSRKSDVFNEFFNPVLSNSKHYRRFGGVFSSKRFALAAEGLQNFIKENRGTMELAIIPRFSTDDVNALLNGVAIDDIITKNWIDDLSQIKERILEDHLKAISWMIANKHLEVKLILPEHSDGIPFTESEIMEMAIFRREIGIFYNKDDATALSFHGTIDRDDSEVGELYLLNVSRKWIETEKDQINADHEEFTNYWDSEKMNVGKVSCRIQPLSIKLTEYFQKNAPATISDIPTLKKIPVLRKYQIEAIDMWLENGGIGIFEMATGTGKTFTAIGGIKKIHDRESRLLVIISVPYKNLLYQWKNELSKWFIDVTILKSGTWQSVLNDEIIHMNCTTEPELSIMITSHDLFSTKKFVEQIKKCVIPTMLLVDEAHHVGTTATRSGLSDHYVYRLALSATIDRYFDDDGTEYLRNYFKGTIGKSTVAEYSLEKAITDKLLCGYNYYPFFIDLTEEEFFQYKDMTYKAARLLNSKKPEERERGKMMIISRAKIIRDAENKFECFAHVLKELQYHKHTLVFCSENQFDKINEILRDPLRQCNLDCTFNFRRITYDNPSNPKERTKILSEFAEGDLDILLSNNILNEGMDIPQARNCIIMASTGNPTQFIQRRGRVLRTYTEPYKDGSHKTHADIFDILIRPQIEKFDDPDSIKLEMGIIKSQLAKITKMGNLAINNEYCLDKIKEFTYELQF